MLLPQPGKKIRHSYPATGCLGQSNNTGTCLDQFQLAFLTGVGQGGDDCLWPVLMQESGCWRSSEPGIENNRYRIFSICMANGQPGIVNKNRIDSNQNRIMHGSQLMCYQHGLVAANRGR